MRTGRLLGAGRTADVYELHDDESESGTDGHGALADLGGAGAPDGLDDRDGVDGHTGPGGRGRVDGPAGPGERDGGDAVGGDDGQGGVGGPGVQDGVNGPGRRDGAGGLAGPGGPAGAWVLRRYRDGWGDAAAEAEVMEYVRGHGYPVPRVRSATRTEMVLERLSGPTMLEAFGAGRLDPAQVGATLARLLHALHALPPRNHDLSTPCAQAVSAPHGQAAPASRVLHLDLHPENVIVTPHGPQVIDWSNAEEGPPGLDWGISAMILAQVAVDTADFRAEMAHATLVSLLAHQPDGPSALTEEGLVEARRRRAVNPTMTVHEVELVEAAEELIRSLTDPGTAA
ncbi:phosphotransferase [Streptomyces sp. NPDC057474]|uniref:phosphotransferase n=1 Tax=Streptomyces sp. NPDC057474 TaxID=3346144 RepID=UPI003685C17B